MRRLFADRLVLMTGVIVILMSMAFALLRTAENRESGAASGPPIILSSS